MNRMRLLCGLSAGREKAKQTDGGRDESCRNAGLMLHKVALFLFSTTDTTRNIPISMW